MIKTPTLGNPTVINHLITKVEGGYAQVYLTQKGRAALSKRQNTTLKEKEPQKEERKGKYTLIRVLGSYNDL